MLNVNLTMKSKISKPFISSFSDNYGFVTFAYKNDAYEAVEHGNDNPTLPRYDLCFGGRRAFCKVKYADLGKNIFIVIYL